MSFLSSPVGINSFPKTNSFLRKLMKSESAFIQIELETITFSENRSPIHLVKTAVNA